MISDAALRTHRAAHIEMRHCDDAHAACLSLVAALSASIGRAAIEVTDPQDITEQAYSLYEAGLAAQGTGLQIAVL